MFLSSFDTRTQVNVSVPKILRSAGIRFLRKCSVSNEDRNRNISDVAIGAVLQHLAKIRENSVVGMPC